MSKIEEIYDNHIWKELEKEEAVPTEVILFYIRNFMLFYLIYPILKMSPTIQVYLNALGLLLRLDIRDALKDSFEDRLKLLAARLTDQVNHSTSGMICVY